MPDPNDSYQPYTDFSGAPKQERKIPGWAWIGGGIAVLVLCCGLAACGLLFFAQGELGSSFEGVMATLEAADGQSSSASSTRPAEPTTSSGVLRQDPVVESNPVDPNSPALSEADWLYIATFDRTGGWADGQVVGSDGSVEAEGLIQNGVFDLTAYAPDGIYWTSPSERFDNGTYQVDATAVSGPENNGFGLMFLLDEDTNDFYLFEVSSDGYVWIGFCANGCEQAEAFIEDGWFESGLVRTGLGNTNRLTVEVNNGEMRFLINDQEVATAADTRLISGDMGLLVESFDEGDVRVYFDNAAYAPLP